MSSNSGTTSEPPAKRAKVEHKSDGVVDDGPSDQVVSMADPATDEAMLEACSDKARELDKASELRKALGRRVKVEGEREELAAVIQGAREANGRAEERRAGEVAVKLEENADAAILAACSTGAIVLNAAARAREVAVKVEEGVEAGEAERAAILPEPVLAVDDRVEIFWDGEQQFFAGTVVRINGGRVGVLYDDGDEGSYDMEKEVWRLEGDGAGEDEEEVNEEEEEGVGEEDEGEDGGGEEEEGEEEKEEVRGESDQEESTGGAKKQFAGSWHRCGVGGCVYMCKKNGYLKQHKANIHGIDVKWFKCDQCDYKCKENGSLTNHKARIHGIDVTWFKCDQCAFKSKQNCHLKQHKASLHDIDVQWSKCDQCAFTCKRNSDLKRHKTNIHGIDVKWIKCDQCDFECKQNGNLSRHKARKH